jgi:hypothetical protein
MQSGSEDGSLIGALHAGVARTTGLAGLATACMMAVATDHTRTTKEVCCRAQCPVGLVGNKWRLLGSSPGTTSVVPTCQ